MTDAPEQPVGQTRPADAVEMYRAALNEAAGALTKLMSWNFHHEEWATLQSARNVIGDLRRQVPGNCRICAGRIHALLPTLYCSPACADKDADFHRDHHAKPEHNSDGWVWCETCGGWVVVR